MKHRSTTASVLGAAVLLAGVAGVATASGPDGSGDAAKPGPKGQKGSVTTVHIKDGTIRQKDLSPAVRAKMAPPKVYAVAPENSVNVTGEDGVEVAAQTLPAGTYAVQANLTLFSNASGIGSCALLVDSDSYNLSQFMFPAGGGRASINVSSVLSSTKAMSPSVHCWTPGTGNASEIRLTSIAVTP